MDRTLSFYFKLKSDHRSGYSTMRSKKEYLKDMYFAHLYDMVQDPDVSFQDYFFKRFKVPYDDWSSLDHHRMDAVIRFENMSEEFDDTLKKIGIQPVRQLPKSNSTKGREKGEFESYFEPVKDHAVKIFGPFMQQSGYEFPEDWNVGEVPRSSIWMFNIMKAFRKPFWRLLY